MKNYMNTIKVMVISLSICCSGLLHAIVVGSNSLVSLQPSITFPAVDTDNTMLGFAWFKNGFTLANASTTCVFDSVFPVSGAVNLNGGNFSLLSDLDCGSGVIFAGNSSVVNLNDQECNLGQSDLHWLNSTNWQGSIGALNLFSNVTLSNAWSFSGHCILTGNGHTLDLSNGGIIIQPGSTLELRNIILKNIAGTNIKCIDDAGVLLLDSVDWNQDANFTFTHGSLQFKNDVNFIGNSAFAYQSPQVSTLLANSTLTLDAGFTFSYDPGTSPDLLAFVDHTSLLVLNNNTKLHATLQGLNLVKGSMLMLADAAISSEVNGSSSNGITFGNCNGVNDFIVTLAGGVQLELIQGSLNYKNVMAALNDKGEFTTTLALVIDIALGMLKVALETGNSNA